MLALENPLEFFQSKILTPVQECLFIAINIHQQQQEQQQHHNNSLQSLEEKVGTSSSSITRTTAIKLIATVTVKCKPMISSIFVDPYVTISELLCQNKINKYLYCLKI
ncbi:hypothetical protein Avbf_03080 [Armadillidium vulgare]|nr:hypothetical protein Avbf_03080 [Armadillidium vulgare]